MKEIEVFELQPKQFKFLSNPADIVIGGGSAGGGKTVSLIFEPTRHIHRAGFYSVLFRRSNPELIRPGGVWDESMLWYPRLGGMPNLGKHEYTFPSGAKIAFGHLNEERTVEEWKSSQIALLEFDQLETFTKYQFFYMLSRNRSMCGIQSYVRASANPEPNWLADFLSWWIAEDGYADMNRAGKMRAFLRINEELIWGDSKEELIEKYPTDEDGEENIPKTVAFFPFTIYDNPILLNKDPGYLASLKALPLVERKRLLGDRVRGGNWKVKPAAGNVFQRQWFKITSDYPASARRVRYWDLAATETTGDNDPDYTAGVLMGEYGGQFWILDAERAKLGEKQLQELIKQTAILDGVETEIWIEQEAGAGSKNYLAYLAREVLTGYTVTPQSVRHNKVMRAKPLSSAAENGNVFMIKGTWNNAYLDELHNFPEGSHDDYVDASSGAHTALVTPREQKGIMTYYDPVNISPF